MLTAILRSKCNQTIQFGQLIECNLRNIFLEEKNVEEELFPDSFLKIQKSVYLWINILSFIYFVFTVCQVEDSRNWLKLCCRALAFTSNKAFLKNQKRSGTSLPVSFSTRFLKKNSSCYIILSEQISRSGCLYFVKFWAICVL